MQSKLEIFYDGRVCGAGFGWINKLIGRVTEIGFLTKKLPARETHHLTPCSWERMPR